MYSEGAHHTGAATPALGKLLLCILKELIILEQRGWFLGNLLFLRGEGRVCRRLWGWPWVVMSVWGPACSRQEWERDLEEPRAASFSCLAGCQQL